MKTHKSLNEAIQSAEILLPADNVDEAFKHLVAIAECVVSYVIGLDDAYECQRKLKDYIDEQKMSAQRFRLMLADSSYVHLNLKFFVMNVLKTSSSEDNLIMYGEMFGIEEEDIMLMQDVFDIKGYKTKARKYIADIKRSSISAEAFKDAYRVFNAICPDLMRHIKTKTYTKLRFISSSANIEFYDFHTDLICKAIQTYLKMVPTNKSELHITNYIRNTLNNHTVNIIKSSTTKKRARLVKGESDGFGGNRFEIVAASENQLFHAFGLEETVSYDSLRNSDDNRSEEQRRDSNLNYERIIKRLGKTKKKRELLRLIACEENTKFTRFLKRAKRIAWDQDNVDYHDQAGYEKYFSEVCKFLKVCERKAQRFADRIGAIAFPDHAKERS